MKKLEAVIQPFKIDEVKDALARERIVGMTVTEVRACGAAGGRAQCYRGVEYTVDLMPKLKIELVVDDDVAGHAAEILRSHARTGRAGDGSLVVARVDEVIRIRTGERDHDFVGRPRRERPRLAAAH